MFGYSESGLAQGFYNLFFIIEHWFFLLGHPFDILFYLDLISWVVSLSSYPELTRVFFLVARFFDVFFSSLTLGLELFIFFCGFFRSHIPGCSFSEFNPSCLELLPSKHLFLVLKKVWPDPRCSMDNSSSLI
jgi:hypothetical protein